MVHYSEYNVAFFPLYPLTISILNKLTGFGYVFSALLISRTAFFLVMVYFYRLVKLDFNKRIAYRAVLYICVFPTGFYFFAVYTESIFLLFILMSFFYARKGSWFSACIFSMLASATRSVGYIYGSCVII